MPDNQSEDVEKMKERLADELAAQPQGKRDTQMPPPANINPTGQIGPSPTADTIPPGDRATGFGEPPTAEDPDPGVFDAGGVNASDADGMSRTEAHRD